ncbi:hypothetical protein D3C81_1904750 [compost metagenome]
MYGDDHCRVEESRLAAAPYCLRLRADQSGVRDLRAKRVHHASGNYAGHDGPHRSVAVLLRYADHCGAVRHAVSVDRLPVEKQKAGFQPGNATADGH